MVTCETPAEVTNGRMLWDSPDEPKYNESVKYTCDEGYTLVGSDVLTCSDTGEYDFPTPECKGKPSASMRSRLLVTLTQGGRDKASHIL